MVLYFIGFSIYTEQKWKTLHLNLFAIYLQNEASQ